MEKEPSMETLITGGTGLVGHHLITTLQQRGDTVRALVLPSENTHTLEERVLCSQCDGY